MEKQAYPIWKRSFVLSIAITISLTTACRMVKSFTAANSQANNQNIAPQFDQVNVNQKPVPETKRTPKYTPNNPPPPGFEKFEVLDAGNFSLYSASSDTPFTADTKIPNRKGQGYKKAVAYSYHFTDERFTKLHGQYGTDARIRIAEYESPEKVQELFKKVVGEAIPVEQAKTIKLPRCVGEKSDSDDFQGPFKIMKRYRHSNGSEIVVLHSGDFNMWDCKRGSNREEFVVWTDGAYYFVAEASPYSKVGDEEPGGTGYGRAEELAIAYLAALGQPVIQQ
jgi:hypothetical protein